MVLDRPALFDGTLVDLKRRRFDRRRHIARLEHTAILAVSSSLSALSSCNLLLIMSRIRTCLESTRFGTQGVRLVEDPAMRFQLQVEIKEQTKQEFVVEVTVGTDEVCDIGPVLLISTNTVLE